MLFFLIGYMGSGKSKTARSVAQNLGFRSIDMDNYIEKQENLSIERIFAEKGEEEFRRMESDFISMISRSRENIVIATGGGSPCHNHNMEIMNSCGKTIYLKLSAEKLSLRLALGRGKRPLLKNLTQDQLPEFIKQSLEQRERFYAQAQYTIECNTISDDQIVKQVGIYISAITEKN